MGSSLLLLPRRRVRSWTWSDLSSGVLVFAHELRGADSVGGVGGGVRVDAWADAGPVADPLIATGSARPIYRAARKGGRPQLEFDANNIEDRFMAGSVNRTFTHAIAVGKFRRANVNRDAGQDGPKNFDSFRGVAGLHGYDGMYPGGLASVVLTGQSGADNFFNAYSYSTWRVDGVEGLPSAMLPGLERVSHCWEVSRTATFSGYPTVVGRDRNISGAASRWRGQIALYVGLNNPSAGELASARERALWHLGGSLVCFVGDSLSAGYGVPMYSSHAALLDDAYEGTLDVANLAIPGQGLSVSTYGAGPTLLASDPAKLAALSTYRGQSPRVLIVWAGTNDLAMGRSAAQVVTDLWAYCDARRSEGWKTVVCSLIDRSDLAGSQAVFDAARSSVNASINAQWGAHADLFLDFASSPHLGPVGASTSSTYFNDDKVHLKPLAYSSILFPLVQGAVESFLPALRPN